MLDLIIRIYNVLNMIKDFEVGYSSDSAPKGYMVISHKNKRYAVKIQEIENPSENAFDDVKRVRYLV